MEESLGPELRDLLIDTYISSICDDCDDLYYETLHELMMLQCEEVEGGIYIYAKHRNMVMKQWARYKWC